MKITEQIVETRLFSILSWAYLWSWIFYTLSWVFLWFLYRCNLKQQNLLASSLLKFTRPLYFHIVKVITYCHYRISFLHCAGDCGKLLLHSWEIISMHLLRLDVVRNYLILLQARFCIQGLELDCQFWKL
jgi:hypothetical protein